MLPYTYSTSSFCKRTTPPSANFIGIKSHAQKVINKDKKGNTVRRIDSEEKNYKL
jgi:hypothetical protein